MIRWKILRVDDPGLLGYAKAQVRRLWLGGSLSFSKTIFVNGTEVDIRSTQGPGCLLAYISIIKNSIGDAFVPLGSSYPVFDVLSGKPVSPTSHAITTMNILNALLTAPAISYISAYIDVTNSCVVSTSLFGVNNITDPQAGSIAVADIIDNPREYNFVGRSVFAEYKITSTTYQKGWAELSLPSFVEPFSATFAAQAIANKIVDGPQTFALPMANGAFTLDITITFTGGKITSSTVANSIGNWRYFQLAVSIVNGTNVKVVYRQLYQNKFVYIPASVRQFSLPPSIPGSGSVVDSYTDIKNTYTTLPLKHSASVVAPAYFITTQLFIQTVTIEFDVPGFTPGALVVFRSEAGTTSLSVMNSDGTQAPLVGNRLSYATSMPTPAPSTPVSYVVFGENGTTRTGVGTYSSVSEADNGQWTTALGAYSLRHYRPVAPAIPAANEAYDVQYNGVTVRSALKDRVNIFFNANADESSNTDTTVLNVDGTFTETNSGYIGLTNWDNGSMFAEYDAAVSIVPDVLVVVRINVKTPSMGSIVIALLPFGWGDKCNTNFRNFSLQTVPGGSTRAYLVDMRDEFTAAATLNNGFTDTSEATASAAMMSSLISNIDNASYTDPDDPPGTLPRVPTNADVLKALRKYFKPLVKMLTDASIATDVALAAGSGTYLLVKS